MIEQDSGTGEQLITFSIVHGNEVAVHLGHAVRAARVERGCLALRSFPHLAEHLAAARLVKPRTRTSLAKCVENTCNAYGGKFRSQNRLLPAGRHKGHGGQVVYFVRTRLVEDRGDGG